MHNYNNNNIILAVIHNYHKCILQLTISKLKGTRQIKYLDMYNEDYRFLIHLIDMLLLKKITKI